MKRIASVLIMAGGLVGILLSAGCIQMPTEKQTVPDMRPQISFKIGAERARHARVIVDDLDMGPVGDYLENSSALRILPGTHMLRVSLENKIIFKENFYIGDGVNRTFILK